MKKSKHSLSSWLKEHGDPEVDKKVEEEFNRFMAESYKQDVEQAERQLEEYINQRIIEELESMVGKFTSIATYDGSDFWKMNQRIKELKQ